MARMEPTKEMIDSLFAAKVRRARAMKPEDKLRAGAVLYEYARAIAMAGIRHQHPDATDEQCRELFRQRLKITRQMEQFE
jgi:hypothetical protein